MAHWAKWVSLFAAVNLFEYFLFYQYFSKPTTVTLSACTEDNNKRSEREREQESVKATLNFAATAKQATATAQQATPEQATVTAQQAGELNPHWGNEPAASSEHCWSWQADNLPKYNWGWEYDGHRVELSRDMLDRSRVNVGNVGRLRKLLCRLNSGLPLTVVALGASVTDGNGLDETKGQAHKPTFAHELDIWLKKKFPTEKAHKVHTVAFESADTCYIAKFLRNTYDKYYTAGSTETLDMVIVEFGVNDYVYGYESSVRSSRHQPYSEDYWDFVRCTEAVVRYTLELNQHTAVIFLEHMQVRIQAYFNTAEEIHSLITNAYSIPVVSVKAALFPTIKDWIRSEVPLFGAKQMRFPQNYNTNCMEGQQGTGPPPKSCYLKFFSDDGVHPSIVGHKLMLDMLVHMLYSEASLPRSQVEVQEEELPETVSAPQAEVEALTKYVHVVTSWRYGSGFLSVGHNLQKALEWKHGDWTYSETGHKSPDNKAWGCKECNGNIALRIDIKENFNTDLVCFLGHKKSYENFGDFMVLATTVKPPNDIRFPVADLQTVSGTWDKRASLWVDTEVHRIAVGDPKKFWLVVQPTTPGQVILQDVGCREV